MFFPTPPLTETSQKNLEHIRQSLGIVPPHFEFLIATNPKKFELFIQEITYLTNHPHIQKAFFAFLRFYIATKEHFGYCKSFNTKLLLSLGFTKNQLKASSEDISNIPLDQKHKSLAAAAINAVYAPDTFTPETIGELKKLGWNDADIYDAVDHAAFLFKNARIIKAYTL